MTYTEPKKPQEGPTKRAIDMYLEYNTEPWPTYAEMGAKYGLSRQRVQQIVKKGEFLYYGRV